MTDQVLKRCTKCGLLKDRELDFLKKRCKYRTKSGIKVRYYVASECKSCNAERAAKHRQKLKESGEYNDAVSRWEANRDREHQRRAHREWYRMNRAENLTRPWGKYLGEIDLGSNRYEFDGKKFVAYLERFLVVDRTSNANVVYFLNGIRLTENETRSLRSWTTGAVKRVTLAQADIWAQRFDLPFWEIEEASKIAA